MWASREYGRVDQSHPGNFDIIRADVAQQVSGDALGIGDIGDIDKENLVGFGFWIAGSQQNPAVVRRDLRVEMLPLTFAVGLPVSGQRSELPTSLGV